MSLIFSGIIRRLSNLDEKGGDAWRRTYRIGVAKASSGLATMGLENGLKYYSLGELSI